MSAPVKIYCDGSSLGNPGPSGWSVVISPIDEVSVSDKTRFFTGGFCVSTNNVAELNAAYEALLWIKENKLSGVTIHSDSRYVVTGCNDWLFNWKRGGWKGNIKNAGLWKEIYDLYCHNKTPLVWVKGHDTDPFNNFADAIAGKTAQAFKEQATAFYNKVELGSKVACWMPGKFQDIVTQYSVLQIYITSGTIVLKPVKAGKNLIMSDKEFNQRKFILL